LLKGAKDKHPEIKIVSSSTDSAHDSYENYSFAIEEVDTTPIIALNPRGRLDAITESSFCLADDGTYTYGEGLP